MSCHDCQVVGCLRSAVVSLRFANGLHRYCEPCADAAQHQVLQPKLVTRDWFAIDELGDQAADAGQVAAVRCRTCDTRLELREHQAPPTSCPDCGARE